ncbi:MAG: hypothetical protein M1511_02735 [Deltaproteobacteria bacterium]|nr:hypothetical protein [Deltaproteobacteria bacterium]
MVSLSEGVSQLRKDLTTQVKRLIEDISWAQHPVATGKVKQGVTSRIWVV